MAKAIAMLFIVIDPLGNSPYFYLLTKDYASRDRRKIIASSVWVALFVLAFFAVLGDIIFGLLGVTVDDFRVAAGIVLLIYFAASILEIPLGAKRPPENLAIVPLAMPLLSGPAAVSTVIYIKYVWGLHVALAATLFNLALSYPILLAGERLFSLFGKTGSLLMEKLMSMIMASFAVAMIREGLGIH